MKLSVILEKQILKEGLSPILYHKTSLYNLYNILKTDKFKLSTSLGTSSDFAKNKKKSFFFMSFARSLTSGFFRNSGALNVFLIIDGVKLQQNNKGFPVDYWGASSKVDDYNNDEMYKHYDIMTSKELEDRIISDKKYIDDASKYIKNIYILLPNKPEKYIGTYERIKLKNQGYNDEQIDDMVKKMPHVLSNINNKETSLLRKTLILAKKKEIKTYLFKNFKDIKANNLKKAIKPSEVDFSKIWNPKDYEKPLFRSNKKGYYDRYLTIAYYKDNYKELDRNLQEWVWDLAYRYGYDHMRSNEMYTSLMNDIHNKRNEDNKWINALINILKREKLESIKQLMDLVSNKWKKILNNK